MVQNKPSVTTLARGDSVGANSVGGSSDEGTPESDAYYPYAFVRRRMQVGSGLASFAYTSVNKGPDGQEVELKRIISQREYKVSTRQADSRRRKVYQTRTSFLWKNRFYEVSVYRRPCDGLAVLNVQVASESSGDTIPIPPGFDVVREVTDDFKYSSYYLSLRTTGLASAPKH